MKVDDDVEDENMGLTKGRISSSSSSNSSAKVVPRSKALAAAAPVVLPSSDLSSLSGKPAPLAGKHYISV